MRNLMSPIDTPDGVFHDGNPATGAEGTIVTAIWTNDVQASVRDTQAEMIAVLAMADMQPNPQKQNQLAEAIRQIIGSGDYVTHPYLKLELLKKIDKADIAQQLGNDPAKVASQQLVTTELGKKAGVADVNGKLAKDQNGADIPNKDAFIKNLGLPDKYQQKGEYADKKSTALQEFNGGVRAPYIDAITQGDRTGFRVINKKAIIYSEIDGKVTQVVIPPRSGDAVLTDDLPKLPLLGSGSTRSGMTASRDLGVTYTNSKPYSIFVTVMLQSTIRDSNLITRMRVSDTPASNFYIGTRGNDADILAEATHSQLVLPGERYVVTSSPNSKIVSWVEVVAA